MSETSPIRDEDVRVLGEVTGPLRLAEGCWIAGDGQPCPSVEVHDNEVLVLRHDCMSPLEEAFLRWAVGMWNAQAQKEPLQEDRL